MKDAYSDRCPSLSFVKKWMIRFSNGCETLDDMERSGRPISQDKIDEVAKVIREFPFSSGRSISSQTGIHHSTINKILRDHLHLEKRHAKWIPHLLSKDDMRRRVEYSKELYQFLSNLSDEKLCNVVTCDESWFYLNYFTSDAWLPEGEELEIPKRMIGDQKIMIFSAFSSAGPLLLEVLPRNSKFTSAYMCEVILPKLNNACRTQLKVRSNQKIFIHMDNAKPHTAGKTIKQIMALKFKQLPHPPYSPDISPCDFFLYGYIKEQLKGIHHDTPEELYQSIVHIVENVPKDTWLGVYKEWISRLQSIMTSDGGYQSFN